MKKFYLLFFVFNLCIISSCTDDDEICTCTYESQGWNGGQVVDQTRSVDYPCHLKSPCE